MTNSNSTGLRRWLLDHSWVGYIGIVAIWALLTPFYRGGLAQSQNLGAVLALGFFILVTVAVVQYVDNGDLRFISMPLAAGLAVVVLGSGGVRDLDCNDFDLSVDAQSFVDAVGWMRSHNLDADGDGLACERERQLEIDEGILEPDGTTSSSE